MRRQWRSSPTFPTEQLGRQKHSNLKRVITQLEGIQASFHRASSEGKNVSIADLIVLAGGAAIEKAAADGGHPVPVPFQPGRGDANEEQTDSA